ncbi:nucleotidyl transferase AbiEii/AbiGii toxin family protein [Kaistella montana]|uniref:Nucleotidyl transferase AbiEii/AbiGii toxin family protein n=1 Tax=Kaistella montana TaxID=1849733 RepID=A0ABW5K835_9FLAO|nr:nucleotidyl transferase AbiEii/AbiGii toxin family protein [Kaistella montana]MCQ4035387.1 nucleotidyl transferase AbiEii/AbiGii toxin family protein [Kaistella montana]
MKSSVFESFRLVGGTALSLQLGHRLSVDIDMFSDEPYGSIDFKAVDEFIEKTFPYHHHFSNLDPAMGKSYSVGTDKDNVVKLDVFYTDAFIQSPLIEDEIRMATTEEIIAMKIDVVQRIGRKKDFWDMHELLLQYDLSSMLSLHQQRYPYSHDEELIMNNLTNFDLAEDDFDPICLRGKYW